MEKLERLQNLVDNSQRIVFFGGAGVSTESGIPDFRSVDGLYNQRYDYPPETILSHSFFMDKTDKFYDFYREKMLYENVLPNNAHKKLAELEKNGKLTAIITQNIDGLHQLAGSKTVLELHGSVLRNYCMKCKKFYSLEEIKASTGVPTCSCGGVIKPDVVLYEEALNNEIVNQAVEHLKKADLVIVGGTSLTVYPAAGLLDYTRGKIVLINRSATKLDNSATLVISDSIAKTLNSVKA